MEQVSFQPFGMQLVVQVPVLYAMLNERDRCLLLEETFLMGKTSLGRHQILWPRTNNDQLSQIPSIAFFCSLCGEIWARRIRIPEHWIPEERLCLKHGDGSLLFDTEDYFEGYPRDLILYELMLATKDLS